MRASVPTGPERLINAEAERLIVGNILACSGFFRRIGPQLTDDCFAVEQYRRVFQLARGIHEHGADPTLSECYRFLIDAGKTSDELGLPTLSALAFDNMVEITNPQRWLNDLRSKAAERLLWRTAEKLRLGVESGIDPAEELAAARDALRAIEGSFDAPAASVATIAHAVESVGIDVLLAAPRGIVLSPWQRLNNLTNDGPRPGELWLIGARPSVGKSTACLQWALAAARANHRVLFISLEMPRQDLLKRVLSAEGDIPHGLLVRGDLDSAWRYRVAQTLDRIGDYPLKIDDQLRTLPAIIGKLAATPGLGLLVIDYLGLVDSGGRHENRNQEVSVISRRLKLAALDYNIPIIAAHQLNRANESANRRPQLSDLRDSGSLEQDADAVILLDAPGKREKSTIDKDRVDIILGKQRNGVSEHAIPLRLEGRFCRMIEEAGSPAEERVRNAGN
jgi:replicative DNA helicase